MKMSGSTTSSCRRQCVGAKQFAQECFVPVKSYEGLEEFREVTPLASSFDVDEAALPLQCISKSWSDAGIPQSFLCGFCIFVHVFACACRCILSTKVLSAVQREVSLSLY